MPARYATPRPPSQAEITAARNALVAIERTCAELEAQGIAPHLEFDFTDSDGVLRHDSFACESCERRDLARRYRALMRATVIRSVHDIRPKLLSAAAIKAHDQEMARLHSIHEARGDKPVSCIARDPVSGEWRIDPVLWDIGRSIEARMNEMGEIEPGAKYAPRRIEIAAEIERRGYVADAHIMKTLEIEQRDRVLNRRKRSLGFPIR